MRKKIKTILYIFFICLCSTNVYAWILSNEDYSKGPLMGKTMYIPLSIYYNFKGLSAKSAEKFQFNYHVSMYYTNDYLISNIVLYENGDIGYDVIRDYEGFSLELGVSFFLLKNLEIGMDFILYTYYGGFLDNVIETFHNTFGFPNAGREYREQNSTLINIENDNNVLLNLDEPAVSPGDIDLWVKYTFFEKKWISLAVLGAFKIPTGRLSGISVSGSGYPDLAFGILADFRPIWLITFYVQAGLVIPLDSLITYVDSSPYPMFNGLLGLELSPVKIFSILVQMNIKTSGLRYDLIVNKLVLGFVNHYTLPQLNIIAGVVFKYKGYRWQFYFEEDAFTNVGCDITLNLSFSHSLKFKRRS